MSLPWIRLDTGLPSHDKILALVGDSHPKRYQAAFSYVCALAWSGDHGTDGRVPLMALPFIHGTVATARLLVIDRGYGPLWTEHTAGWQIVNFGQRQELAAISAGKAEAQRVASAKANCARWHGPDCWIPTKGCGRA